MYYIGFDIGSSSVKAALVRVDNCAKAEVVSEPSKEMEILSPHPGWAEQNPETWWKHLCKATKRIINRTGISPNDIVAIGISYQMHGLILVDKKGESLRNSIIWCDGRAVDIGNKAYNDLGARICTQKLLNSPANFTASKLKWIKENEPETYKNIHKIMLPGDYIAYRLSGEITTTIPGLSEGIFWDFENNSIADWLLDYYGLEMNHIPSLVDTFSEQGVVSNQAARESGLPEGIPILYRAGDQPNNALTLNVFQPGEVAATAGTSGVLYAVTNSLMAHEDSGVNNFAHVNHEYSNPRIGKLLCINGAGIQYRWLLNNLKVNSYEQMNDLAATVPIGSQNLSIYPFGNGPERMFGNRQPGAGILGLDFNSHTTSHLCRAALEGIAFSLFYGMQLLNNEGMKAKVIRAGNDNMFRAPILAQTITNLVGQEIEIYDNTGAIGAARACSLVKGDFKTYGEQVEKMDLITKYKPDQDVDIHKVIYHSWKQKLDTLINN